MVKQTKKGSIGKKALSAILAASMIMTSSSFVMAAPVVEEVEAVAVEESVAAEEVDVEEENVNAGVELQNVTVTVEDATYTGAAVEPKVTVVGDGEILVKDTDYTLGYFNNNEVTDNATVTVTFIGDYVGNDDITKEFSIKPLVLNASNVKVEFPVAGYIYDGKKQEIEEAAITSYGDVKQDVIDSAKIAYDTYSTSYDLKSVGSQKAKLVDKDGNLVFDDSIGVYDFTIDKADFTDAIVEVDESSKNSVYTGKPVEANIVLKVKDTKEVIDPSTYSIKYFDKDDKVANGPQTDVGTYKIQIVSNGSGNFKAGAIDDIYEIIPEDYDTIVAAATIAGTTKVKNASGTGYEYNLTYTGKEQSISPEDINIPGLTQGVDYEVDCSDAYGTDAYVTNGGTDVPNTFEVKLTGKNNYAAMGDKYLTVNIKPLLITENDFTITAKCNKLAASSVPTEDDMVVTIEKGDLKLVSGTDFVISEIDTKNSEITITGKGNFTTIDEKNDKQNIIVKYTKASKLLIERVYVEDIESQPWSGKQITPVVEVKKTETDTVKLEKGVDYQVSYGKNVDAGDGAGTVTITGIGKYEGSLTKKFNITGKNIADSFKVEANNVTVDAVKAGNGKSTPIVSFKNGASAPADLTFDVKYYAYRNNKPNNKGAELTDSVFKALEKDDKVVIEVIGTGKYTGTIYNIYSVVKAEDIASVADVADIADQDYTGKAIEPTVIVSAKTQGVVLTRDKDYTVSYLYNTEVGTAYAIVAGKGIYAGEIVKSFKIVGEMTQNIEVLPAQEKALQSRTLNDKATKVKYTSAPKTAVTYTSSNENVVTVDAEGNIKYTGLGEATITIKAAKENGYNEAVKELKVVVGLKQPTFSPSSKNNAFTVTTSTVKGAEKFQVQYVPTGKSFTNKAAKTKTFTVDKKLVKGRISAANKETYRVRVRAINGTTKSKWSPVKTIATK